MSGRDEAGTRTAGDTTNASRRLAGLEVRRRPGRVVLLVTDGVEDDGEPREVEVHGTRVTAGRSAVNELQLDDGSVSGTHFELRLTPDGISLRDLGSTNGTWIGETRVQHVWIQPGAVFKAGSCPIEVSRVDEVDVAISEERRFGDMVGSSPAMREVFAELDRAADNGGHILLLGGPGSGKEHAARGVHGRGTRSSGPFVVLDCASLPHAKARAALLGHRKNAFDGATEDTAGVLERAHGGTLFLDEVGELPMDVQADLHQALETGKLRRVGSDEIRDADVRVVAASRRDPRRLVGEGSFREDLYLRLASPAIELPPLRERGDDAAELALRFVKSSTGEGEGRELSESAIAAIRQHAWPGNVRELKRTIKRAVHLASGDVIEVDDLRLGRGPGRNRLDDLDLFSLPAEEARAEFERQYYRRLMAETLGDIGEAARRSGVSREALQEALTRLDL